MSFHMLQPYLDHLCEQMATCTVIISRLKSWRIYFLEEEIDDASKNFQSVAERCGYTDLEKQLLENIDDISLISIRIKEFYNIIGFPGEKK